MAALVTGRFGLLASVVIQRQWIQTGAVARRVLLDPPCFRLAHCRACPCRRFNARESRLRCGHWCDRPNAQTEIGNRADQNRQPELCNAIREYGHRRRRNRNSETHERGDIDTFDDAEPTGSNWYRCQHIRQPERDEQAIGRNFSAECTQEEPERQQVEHPIGGAPRHHTSQHVAFGNETSHALAKVIEQRCRCFSVATDAVVEPSHRSVQAPLVVDQPEHDCPGDRHQHGARYGCRAVDGARATQRNRNDETDPQQTIENHRRADARSCQGKTGV